LQEVKITSQVKKIRGTKNNENICNIYFENKGGKEIAKMVAGEQKFFADQIIEDDEEIIGIYGTLY
jgi:hypothetical protein